MGTSTEMEMRTVKVRYVSDIKSIYFKKGEIYQGFISTVHPELKLIAFFFTEEEMDSEGLKSSLRGG